MFFFINNTKKQSWFTPTVALGLIYNEKDNYYDNCLVDVLHKEGGNICLSIFTVKVT